MPPLGKGGGGESSGMGKKELIYNCWMYVVCVCLCVCGR